MPIDEESLLDSIAYYLKPEKDVLYLRSEPGEVPRSIGGVVHGDKTLWLLRIEIKPSERGDLFLVGVNSCIDIPEPQRVNVDDLLKQVNFSYRDDFELDTGNPELQLIDNSVTCNGWIELKEAMLNESNFALLIEKCITIAEAYFEAIMLVGFGGIDPSVAMESMKKKKVTANMLN